MYRDAGKIVEMTKDLEYYIHLVDKTATKLKGIDSNLRKKI